VEQPLLDSSLAEDHGDYNRINLSQFHSTTDETFFKEDEKSAPRRAMSAKRSNSQKQRTNSQGKRSNSQKGRTGSQKSRKYSTATSVVSFDIPELFVRHNFEVRTTPYRWPLVFFFAFNITAISCMSLSMSPQSSLLKYAYNVSV